MTRPEDAGTMQNIDVELTDLQLVILNRAARVSGEDATTYPEYGFELDGTVRVPGSHVVEVVVEEFDTMTERAVIVGKLATGESFVAGIGYHFPEDEQGRRQAVPVFFL
jgi:hypothetical protein